MIWLAIVVEAAIGNWIDMVILLVIQFANCSIAFYEMCKAGDAVAALKASLKPFATVKRDGVWKTMDATLLVPGDLISLGVGAAIPADSRVNEGEVDIDTAQLTGESLPVTMHRGDKPLMGSTVARGEVEATVEFTGGETFFGKTASLLGGTAESSNLQNLLCTIMICLVILSLSMCSIVFVYLLSLGTTLIETLSFTVVLIVASIPLAIEIVTTTTLAVGSKELSKHGAIVTRLSAIEDLAGMSILCSDKTGTLTLNKMVIQPETPVYEEGLDQYTLLRYGAMAAKWKEPPKDALDTLVLKTVDMESMEGVEQSAYMPFDPVVKRTEGTVTENGKTFKCTKGAPNVLLKLIGDAKLEKKVMDDVDSFGLLGTRCLAVAKTDESGRWKFLGLLTFLDPPRPDTKKTIADAREYGVQVKMITGDHANIARQTALVLEMGPSYGKNCHIIDAHHGNPLPLLDPVTKQKPPGLSDNYGELILGTDGFAGVYPEHKYLIVECLREMGYKTGMTGDGVNDAPALKRADVGIAVQGATDAAAAAADIVLTEPGLSTIVEGIFVARCIFIRIRNFITYRIAATMDLLMFFFIAVFLLHPYEFAPANPASVPGWPDSGYTWPKFFHMPVLMLMLITLLNDGTLIAIGYDNAIPPKDPSNWNLPLLFLVGFTLASVSTLSSLLLLFFCLESWNPDGLFQKVGIGGLSYGQITTTIYLKISISGFLTLFAARAGDDFFWTSSPAPILLIAGGFALTMSTVLACVWPTTYPDGIYTIGLEYRQPYIMPLLIWVYCLFFWVVQDCVKVCMFYLLNKYAPNMGESAPRTFEKKTMEPIPVSGGHA
jgi:H+-transporting ATPase